MSGPEMDPQPQRLKILFLLCGIPESAADITAIDKSDEIAKFIDVLKSNNKSGMLGDSDDASSIVEVEQWMAFALKLSKGELDMTQQAPILNEFLQTRSFFAGPRFTAADAAVFASIQQNSALEQALRSNINLRRWFRHVSTKHAASLATGNSEAVKNLLAAPPCPTLVSIFSSSAIPSAPAAPTAVVNPAQTEKTGKNEKKEGSDIPHASPAQEVAVVGGDADRAAKKASKEIGKEGKDGKEGKKKDTKAAASAGGGAAESGALDPSKLDIRVGYIKKCWNHPESDKLLCEEIDLGSADGGSGGLGVRLIASGLRAHYAAEQVQGQLVIVLTNLKERPMAGFKSQGMVMCACNADHTVVKLVSPPAGAKPGDRITFPGFSALKEGEAPDGAVVPEPASSSQIAKKKILEGLFPGLRTDEAGVAMWENSPFTVTLPGGGSGVCTSSLASAAVS